MFYVLLLKLDITKKRQIDENKKVIKSDINNNNKEYKVEAIWNTAIYVNKSAKIYISRFSYLIS